MVQLSDEMKACGAQPVWLGYIAVDDVDASANRVVAAGGAVSMPAVDIADVGRIALVTDPQGAPFYLMRGIHDVPSAHSLRIGRGSATAPGTSWSAQTRMRPKRFILPSSAGARTARCQWGLRATTRSFGTTA